MLNQPVKNQRQHRWIWWIIVGLIIVGWSGLAFGVYRRSWTNPSVKTISAWLPLPIAALGWHPISVHQYLIQRQAVEINEKYLSSSSGGVYPAPTTDLIRTKTITTMIRSTGANLLAAEYKLTVTSTDIDQAYQTQLLQNGNRTDVTDTISKLYGWSPAQFKKYVIKPTVIRDKIQEKLSFDDQLNVSARQQAGRVYDLVKQSPTTFGELAKKYSDDAYGAQGGDLNWVSRGELAKEIDDAAFSTPLNQISSLIHTKYGWHVVMPLERRVVDGQEQTHLLQITIAAPNVDRAITNEINKHRVMVMLNGLAWDSSTGQVAAK